MLSVRIEGEPATPPAAALATLALSKGARVALVSAVAVLAAAYVALLWSLDGLPYEDLPNHLSRAVVIADMLFHAGRRFGDLFTFKPALNPYILGDLALASLVEVAGPYAAGRLWMILIAASLPLSLAVYLRAAGHSTYHVLVAGVVGLYLGTDWFFVNGFTAFRLGVAATLLSSAAWTVHLRTGSARAYLGYLAMLVAGYLTHFSALILSAAAVGALSAVALRARRVPASRLALGALPFLALFGWHALFVGAESPEPALWRLPLVKKIARVASPFQRYDAATEGALAALFAGTCALMSRGWRRARASPPVVSAVALAAAFAALYVALPYQKGNITYIDVRALPCVAVFALACAAAVAEREGKPRLAVVGLSVLLAAANLLVLTVHLRSANTVMVQYRALAARIPPRATVLPIVSQPRDGRSEPYDSAGTFATIEAGAMTPYIFEGGAQPYFRARALPYAPNEYWYRFRADPGDGATLARTYDFVLAMRPFDRARLPMRTEELARNDAAVLLKVVR